MAEDSTNKTEQPTPRRLRKAREEGNLPTSNEFLSAASLIALTLTAVVMAPAFIDWAMEEIKLGFSCRSSNIAEPGVFLSFLTERLIQAVLIMSPFFIALLITGTAASVFTSGGFNLSAKTLKWKLSELNPAKGLKKLFSVNSLVKLIFSIVKIVFISAIVWIYINDKYEEMASFRWAWSTDILAVIGKFILGVLIRMCAGLLIIGLVDFAYQKFRYIDKLKMTKQDIKDEHKDNEGPPEVKRKIRQKQFEATMRRMMQDVPKADVVLVNPTHVAVALKYDHKNMAAPVVVAKGADVVCEKIKEVARAYGVPIIRRPQLARDLFGSVKIGMPIPDALYIAVAEIMAIIYRLRKRK